MFSYRQFLTTQIDGPGHHLADGSCAPANNTVAQQLSYVTENGTERCCICGCDTRIPATLPIEMRTGYVEGVGQLCLRCR